MWYSGYDLYLLMKLRAMLIIFYTNEIYNSNTNRHMEYFPIMTISPSSLIVKCCWKGFWLIFRLILIGYKVGFSGEVMGELVLLLY
jgi:hypothetical protein